MKNLILASILLFMSSNYSTAATITCEKGEPTDVLFFKPDRHYGLLVFFEWGRGGYPVDAKSFEGADGYERVRSIQVGQPYLVCGEMTPVGFLVWKLAKK